MTDVETPDASTVVSRYEGSNQRHSANNNRDKWTLEMRSRGILDSENYRYRDRVALLVFIEVTIACKLYSCARDVLPFCDLTGHPAGFNWTEERCISDGRIRISQFDKMFLGFFPRSRRHTAPLWLLRGETGSDTNTHESRLRRHTYIDLMTKIKGNVCSMKRCTDLSKNPRSRPKPRSASTRS